MLSATAMNRLHVTKEFFLIRVNLSLFDGMVFFSVSLFALGSINEIYICRFQAANGNSGSASK